MTPPVLEAVSWAVRPLGIADHGTVLGFFEDPAFFFRTPVPDTLSQTAVLGLLTDTTRLILADGEPAGLLDWELMGPEHTSHHRLYLRLRHGLAPERWRQAYDEAVAALRWRTEVVTVTTLTGEYDPEGTQVLRDHPQFRYEGCLRATHLRHGRRYGHHHFSRHWADTP